MRVLVTGAGGFVGRALVRDLAARGHHVRAGVRREQDIPGAAERWTGDLETAGDLGPAVAGVEAVIHLAARVHITGDTAGAAYRTTNAEATLELAKAAQAAGVRRFVFASSVKAAGETSASPLTEADEPHPADPYGASKWEAERRLRDPALVGLEVVVLRPPLVYGPGARANFKALMRLCDTPVPVPLGAATANLRSVVYLGNLTDALCLALSHPAAAGRTYFVCDGEDLSPAGLAALLRRALGRRPCLVAVPRWVFAVAGRAIDRPEAAARLFGALQADDAAIREELGWRPPFTTAQGLAATAAWLRASRAVTVA